MSMRGVCWVFSGLSALTLESSVRAFWHHDLLRFALGMFLSICFLTLYWGAYPADRKPGGDESA